GAKKSSAVVGSGPGRNTMGNDHSSEGPCLRQSHMASVPLLIVADTIGVLGRPSSRTWTSPAPSRVAVRPSCPSHRALSTTRDMATTGDWGIANFGSVREPVSEAESGLVLE